MTSDPKVKEVFNRYPKHIKKKLLFLRKLVLETAAETEEKLEETLKWGEPSYLTKHGSTVRMDWKESTPEQYAMYFNCNTKLIDTFKELYREKFTFQGNLAIIFDLNDEIPIAELKHCIALALHYHRIKHLPLLGA